MELVNLFVSLYCVGLRRLLMHALCFVSPLVHYILFSVAARPFKLHIYSDQTTVFN